MEEMIVCWSRRLAFPEIMKAVQTGNRRLRLWIKVWSFGFWKEGFIPVPGKAAGESKTGQ